ncbi:MAG: phage GP46 family protein [Treponema sp.]|jgi:phage gp46-like protein|nr:phage GP46 family protein [Treponema sp.]
MERANKPAVIENWNDIRELVLMSIGTDKGSWWADPNFGSELWLLRQSGKADGRAAGTLRRMILECTQWLINDGLIKKIDCEAERTGKNEISYYVTMFGINGSVVQIKEVWNAV